MPCQARLLIQVAQPAEEEKLYYESESRLAHESGRAWPCPTSFDYGKTELLRAASLRGG
jgi:hypothetical protein